jgi:hypothetical protein
MNKKTKVYLGVGALAVAAYYIWNKSKTSSTKANAVGKEEICYSNIPYLHRVPCNDPRAKQSFASVQGKGINYRKAGSICHYMYGDEYMVGRVNSYDNNICEGSSTRGIVL